MERSALTELRQMAERMATVNTTSQWPAADEVMRLALRALQESEGIIARLRAELDAVHERTVFHCMSRDLDDVMLSTIGEQPGAIIRTTDTGQEYELSGGTWRERTTSQ
jgi:hypothetical protein